MTEELSAEEVAELEAAEKAATPAPWCQHPNGGSVWTGDSYDSTGEKFQFMLLYMIGANDEKSAERAVSDAVLVVEARNALPRLLESIRQRDRRLAEAEKERDEARDTKKMATVIMENSVLLGERQARLLAESRLALAEQKLEAAMRVVRAAKAIINDDQFYLDSRDRVGPANDRAALAWNSLCAALSAFDSHEKGGGA